MHPDEYELLQYLESSVTQMRRAEIEDHIAGCGSCAHLLADLSRLPRLLESSVPFELDPAVLKKAVNLTGSRRTDRRSGLNVITSPFRVAMAGAALAAVVLTVYLVVPQNEPDRFRSATEDEVPAFHLVPADGAVVTEHLPEFQWNAVGASSAYRFNLLEGSGALLWNTDVRDTSVVLPSSVVLQPGFTYLWRIESFLADNTIARSALHAFTYSPPP